MRIAIDYTPAIAWRHGIGRYTRCLVDALVRLDTDDRITLFSAERPRAGSAFPSGPNVRSRVLPIGQRAMTILWDRARIPLPAEMVAGRADVVHGPAFAPPPALRMRRIATVHDLASFVVPEFVPPKFVAYQRSLVPRTVRHADHLIADSQSTADDLVSLLGVAREKISVVHLGVEPKFAPLRDREHLAALDARYGLAHPLVLALGSIEPRKRYDKLVEAFARARTTPGGPKMLAIAGSRAYRAEEVAAAAHRFGVEDAVAFLEYIPEDDIVPLYNTADVLAMPARYEGFGLPAVEAMACGTPVVTSTTGSLPEVTGDAALHADVDADGALADALVRATGDAGLREALIARGIERAASFTWDRAARQVLDIYHRVASEGKRATRR
jgi:glycosyltransferase involved in cell wall biosynthesis